MPERLRPLLWAASAARSLWLRVRDDPLRVLRWGSARLPSAWARRLWPLALELSRRSLRRRRHGAAAWVLQALALDALGQRSLLCDLVTEVEARGGVRARRWTGRACLAADPALAVRLAAGLPHGPERAELEGRALTETGALGQAAAVLARAAVRYPRARRLAGWQARVEGQMRLLDPNWQPGITGVPRRAGPPVPGRALHLVTTALPFTQAGYTIRSQRLARAQQEAGLDPHLVTRPGFPLLAGHLPARAAQRVAGVPTHWLLGPALPVGPDAILQRHVDAAWALAQQLRPAVLHPASDHRNARVALALRERLAVPVVYEVRGFLEETRRTRQPDGAAETDVYRRSRAAETACMCRADHVVTLGEAMRHEIVSRGVPAERVTVIPNAADAAFLGHLPDVRGLRSRLGVTPGDVLIGSVSTLNAYEGLDDLVRALAILIRRRLPARLLLVGDGPSRGPLERLAEHLGVGDRIAFTGRVPHAEILAYHAVIDVFAVPRTAARVCRLVAPLKPVEAMATGRAVVVSRLPALTELVRHGVTGLTVDPEHPGALAEALGGLCEDPDLRRELGRNARTWTAEHRTWRGNGQRYRALYAALGVALPPRPERCGPGCR